MGYIFVVSVIPFRHVPQFRAEHVQCEDSSFENMVVTTYFGNFASYSSSKPNQLRGLSSGRHIGFFFFAFLSTLRRIINIIIIITIIVIIIIFICLARNLLLE
jgi:hypothetical protein